MNADEAIPLMRGPRNMHIICVDVTNKCDLACSNCTRLLENQDTFWDMTPENFRLALQSLKDYHGIIAMIGGNPCMHPKFKELCQIFVEEIPNKMQRGLWTNNFFKHGKLCQDTFGTFNLNSHGNDRAEPHLESLHNNAKAAGALSWFYKGQSDHAPILTAIKDLYPEDEMWEKPTMYAVKKVGGVRAKSVHTSEEDAKANLPPKDYVIEVRHGERTRCKSYCQVAGFCSQYKRYLAENPQE